MPGFRRGIIDGHVHRENPRRYYIRRDYNGDIDEYLILAYGRDSRSGDILIFKLTADPDVFYRELVDTTLADAGE